MTSLLKLPVFTSNIHSLHPLGLPACHVLQSLTFVDCCINAVSLQDWFDSRSETVGAKLSCLSTLTSLTSLRLAIDKPALADLSSIFSLTALQKLEISIIDKPLDCFSSFSALQSLSYLRLMVVCDTGGLWDNASCNVTGCITLALDWARLQALQTLCGTLVCDALILGLIKVKSLRLVKLVGCKPQDSATSQSVMAPTYQLAKYRPEVNLVIDGKIIAEIC